MVEPFFSFLTNIFNPEDRANCLLIGGFAVNYYGYTRQTVDVDFLIECSREAKFSERLSEQGYIAIHRDEVFVKYRCWQEGRMDIDFMLVDKTTLDGMLREAVSVNYGEVSFLLPSLMHLIALKLHSIHYNEKIRFYKDMGDIVQLLLRNEVRVDSEDFRDYCLKYGSEKLYNEILQAVQK
ncbi:MAG: nucleotidyltransferase family protein [Planctomycetes bacterium]|nr:nucleotidyltransferase family protein [Planctomycetota bacterium]